ncbi:MAG TPA: OpgC domain-containing protein [Verrucomicrobiae bacterium]|nr:OpgC domain-containing protein [Verrucomicrobiae bacterium]
MGRNLQTRAVSETRRDAYLDHWRGLFHVLMLVDHLPFLFPGLFTLIAGWFEFLGYVSVAEGFVLLSGYVTGLVYTRVKQENGSAAMWRKALGRAFTIYFTYAAAVMLLIILVKWLGAANVSWGSWGHLLDEPLPLASVEVASLVWQPSFLEILPMYSLFLVFAPVMIALLDRKRHWLVIGASVSLWIANQFGIRGRLLNSVGIEAAHLGYFNFFAWQILFVAGMICGHRTYRVNRPWLPKNATLAFAAYFTAIIFFAWHHRLLEIPINARWVERSSMGALRLLNFACLAFLAARFREPIGKVIGWKGLAFLSRHSLQVFAFHLIPIYAAALFITGRTQLPWWAQLLFIAFCEPGLFYIAWLAKLAKKGIHKPSNTQPVFPASAEDVQTK